MSSTALELKERSKSSGTWTFTIKNFSKYNVMNQQLRSPCFGLTSDDVWYLEVYPQGRIINNGEFLAVYLFCKTVKDHAKPKLKYKCSIISTNFVKAFEVESYHPGISDKRRGWRRFVKKTELLAHKDLYLPNDILTISCKVTRSFDHYATELISVPSSQHLKTLHLLLQNAGVGNLITLRISQTNQQKPTIPSCNSTRPSVELSPKKLETLTIDDSKINEEINESTVEVEDFKVYQGILTSQSPVFKAMFEHKETKESQKNLIEINDMDPEVCAAMLDFLNKDQLHVSKNNLMKLLAAADKYQLTRLKALCAQALFETLSIKNSLIILRDADLYNADGLKKATIEFIVEHIDDIKESDEYKLFKQKNSVLALEIFEKFYDKQKEDD